MEARRIRPTLLGMATAIALIISSPAHSQIGNRQEHVAHSQNFIVFAASPQLAARVSQTAESLRRELAAHWLGKEIPGWSQRCPIHVLTSPRLGAGGETRFSLMPGGVGNWMMNVQGTEQRVLDSVLPHEITHTIFATHFARYNKYVPRWADEGACTTVEHVDEKSKHQHFLQDFLRTGRGISFNKMFSMKDYPNDILPLYAQGHSVVQFLLDQGGPHKFVKFLEEGMRSDNWESAMRTSYSYRTLGDLQLQWNRWLLDGSPNSLAGYAPGLQTAGSESPVALAASVDAGQAIPKSGSFERRSAAENVLAQTAPAPLQGLEGASYASGESWYRNQLRAVSMGAATGPTSKVTVTKQVTNNQLAAAPNQIYPLKAYQASRQPESSPQRNNIQVLDWGNSEPIPGIATQPQIPEMVPLRP